jgi:hypothetical protein
MAIEFVLVLGVVTRASSHPVGSNPLSCSVAVPLVDVSPPVGIIAKAKALLSSIADTLGVGSLNP